MGDQCCDRSDAVYLCHSIPHARQDAPQNTKEAEEDATMRRVNGAASSTSRSASPEAHPHAHREDQSVRPHNDDPITRSYCNTRVVETPPMGPVSAPYMSNIGEHPQTIAERFGVDASTFFAHAATFASACKPESPATAARRDRRSFAACAPCHKVS